MRNRLLNSAESRLLGVFPKADRPLTVAWWAFIVLRGVLPAIFAVSLGALVGAVQDGRPVTNALTAVGIVFVAMNALSPLHGAIGSLLGDKTGAWLHDRLMESSTRPAGLAHLER